MESARPTEMQGSLSELHRTTTHISNFGEISGLRTGYEDRSAAGGNELLNHGTVEGDLFGIRFTTTAGQLLNVVNYGTIEGGIAAIEGTHTGKIALDNHGTIIGNISLTSTNQNDGDFIGNAGLIKGV